MKRTFQSEDQRKNKLFDSWIKYLHELHSRFAHEEFEEIYEGLAVISGISKNRLDLRLDDGRSLRHLPVTPHISEQSSRLDCVFFVLGRRDGKWWPLDVISIGSLLQPGKGAAHITFNPLLMPHSQVH